MILLPEKIQMREKQKISLGVLLENSRFQNTFISPSDTYCKTVQTAVQCAIHPPWHTTPKQKHVKQQSSHLLGRSIIVGPAPTITPAGNNHPQTSFPASPGSLRQRLVHRNLQVLHRQRRLTPQLSKSRQVPLAKGRRRCPDWICALVIERRGGSVLMFCMPSSLDH